MSTLAAMDFDEETFEPVQITADDIYLNAPLVSTEDKAAAIQVMRAESSLLISQQVEVGKASVDSYARTAAAAYNGFNAVASVSSTVASSGA